MDCVGRKEIYTDCPYIDSNNIIDVLRTAYADFQKIQGDCDFLIDYEAGLQPLQRTKTYRKDIDIKCIDNVANEVTTFKKAFGWGSPITLVQRGRRDSGKTDEPKAISLLNEMFEAENIKTKTQHIGDLVEKCGIAYTYIDLKDEYEDGDSLFSYIVLDPRFAFTIKSSYYADRRDMVNVSYRADMYGNRYFTCFTKDFRFEILNLFKIVNGEKVEILDKPKWYHQERSGERNPLGILPFTEWVRDVDRSGCFERQIPDMDALNILESDFANDVDQNTQAIWHTNDVDFPTTIVENEDGTKTETVTTPKTNEWVQTYTTPDGKTPFVTPLAVNYDYAGMLENIITKRSLILQKCGIPQRGDTSGGSTGVAMDGATGWSQAEIEAAMQDQIKEGCKMHEVRIALKVIKISPNTPADSPLLNLRYSDVTPNIKRQKSYEMSTKINTFATGVAHGISPLHMARAINYFDDPQQVIEDSSETLKAYQDSVFASGKTETEPNADRIMQDSSDQVTNSPLIDGMSTGGDEET